MIIIQFIDITTKIKDFTGLKTEFKKLFFSTAIAGEVGEFCNLVKKYHRNDTPNYWNFITKIKLELADIFIYLVLNAKQYGIDLELAIIDKLRILNKRGQTNEMD